MTGCPSENEVTMPFTKSNRRSFLLLCLAAVFALFIAATGIPSLLASEGDDHSHEDEAPTIEALAERIAVLESRIAELELHQKETTGQTLTYPVFDAVSAVYLLDQIDIHALHERLHDGDGIMPGDAGQIRRLVPLIAAVNWPAELAEEGNALAETLTSLAAALADDDLESALPLSSAAHDAQHHFSDSVAEWFACLLVPAVEMEAEDQEQDEHSESDDDGHSHSHDHDDTSDENGGNESGDDNCVNVETEETQDDGHDHSHGG